MQTTTLNGITCTNNGDGTYTLNGTATGKAVFTFQYNITLDIGNYVINSINNLWFSIEMMYEPYTTYGGTYTNKQFYVSSKAQNIKACITIDAGVKLSNVLFKPMLVDAEKTPNATYDDFVPYTGEGETLTEDVAELKNDLDKLNSLPIGSIIQIEEDKDDIETTTQKYGWQYLGKSNIQYDIGSANILVTHVYRKNN